MEGIHARGFQNIIDPEITQHDVGDGIGNFIPAIISEHIIGQPGA